MRNFYLAFFGIFGIAGAQSPADFRWPQRLDHYLHRTYSWQRMTMLGGETLFEHWLDRDAGSLGQRYSSAFGARVVRNTIELGLGGLLREDARFRPSGQHGFRKRLRHALVQTVMSADGRDGRFAYSRLGAKAGAALMVPRPGRIFEEIGSGYLSDFQNNLLSEFSADLAGWGKKLRRRILPKRPTRAASATTAHPADRAWCR